MTSVTVTLFEYSLLSTARQYKVSTWHPIPLACVLLMNGQHLARDEGQTDVQQYRFPKVPTLISPNFHIVLSAVFWKASSGRHHLLCSFRKSGSKLELGSKLDSWLFLLNRKTTPTYVSSLKRSIQSSSTCLAGSGAKEISVVWILCLRLRHGAKHVFVLSIHDIYIFICRCCFYAKCFIIEGMLQQKCCQGYG